MKILAIVVTYFPDKDLLIKNVSSFVDNVEKVLIWENTPKSERKKYRFIEHEKVEYCGDDMNSISHALNYAWNYAVDNKFDYLLTMDQDSQWVDFKEFLSETIYNPNAPIGIWGPYHNDSLQEILEYDAIITSGMLVKTSLISKIGGWNEFFAIDCVDDEFCLSAKRLGINSYIIGMCKMTHHLGNPKPVTVWGKTAYTGNYSHKRLYSIYKNHLVLVRMFPEIQSIKRDFWNYWIPQIKWIVVCEDNHLKKFFAIFRGLLIGLLCQIPSRLCNKET